MKKLILFAAALVCATAVNAATLSWGTDWVYSTDLDNGTVSGSAWLVMVESGGGVGNVSVNNIGAITLGGNTLLGTTGVSGGALLSNPTSLAAAIYNTRDVFVVAYDSGTKLYGISGVWTIAGLSDVPAPNGIAHNFGNDADGYMYLNIPAVPEPTSLALLALGAAAIGLRRRIRKA